MKLVKRKMVYKIQFQRLFMDNFGYIQFFTAVHGPFGESEEENVKKKPNSSVHRQDFSLT